MEDISEKSKAKRVRLSIDCSSEEKMAIKTTAKKFGKTISEYVLDVTKNGISLSGNNKSLIMENRYRMADDFFENLGYK